MNFMTQRILLNYGSRVSGAEGMSVGTVPICQLGLMLHFCGFPHWSLAICVPVFNTVVEKCTTSLSIPFLVHVGFVCLYTEPA